MRVLQRGDTGSDVKILQTALIRAGYDPGIVNGVFGSETERAVKQFQRVLGLPETGIVNAATWQFLEPFANETDPEVLRRGSKGSLVRLAQDALKKAGYNIGTSDALFGTKTRDAVKSFQKARGLPETGVINDVTWYALAPYIDWSVAVLRRGDIGILVGIMQDALKNAGYYTGTVDRIFGSNTYSSLISFQKANNITPDGLAGARTWAKLLPYLSQNVVLYTVQRGDNLIRIARRFNTTLEKILELNPRRDPNLVYVGEVLKIPVNTSREVDEENGTGTPAAQDSDEIVETEN